jgi:hypothetical protein
MIGQSTSASAQALIACSCPERVDVRRGGKRKRAKANRRGGMKSSSVWWIAKSKVFEPNMNRKGKGADQPRG